MNFKKIKEIMVETLGCDEEKVVADALLAEDLNIDSLDAVELVMMIEENTGVKIPDEELPNMKKVSDIVECLDRYSA